MCVLSYSVLSNSATLWTLVPQAPLSMEFYRLGYWSRCHFLLQGLFPTQGLNPRLVSPALAFMTLFIFLVGINTWNSQKIRVKADEAKY